MTVQTLPAPLQITVPARAKARPARQHNPLAWRLLFAFALMVWLLAVLTLLAASGLHGVQAALALATGCVAIAFTSGVGEENAITPTIFLTKSSFVQRVGDAVVACGVYR